MWQQYHIHLPARRRGFHLVGDEIVAALTALPQLRVGLCHLLLQHSSASLLLCESYDPEVRQDMEAWCNRHAAEREPYYSHTLEGDDDMPAHIKCALFGTSLSIPIANGRLALGTWQGIWLGEHRNHASSRSVVATLHGETG